jgi:hypothetical protein
MAALVVAVRLRRGRVMGRRRPAYSAISWRALTRRRSTEGQSSRVSGKELRGDASLG